jgi:signal transduction histidine kinase
MRLLIFELRPHVLARDGLVAALRSRLEAVEGRIGIETVLTVDGYERLSADVEEGLYRVAQEALNNALRHAQPRSVSVRLSREGNGVSLEIADDGVGFDPWTARQRGGLGLRGMEERAIRLGGELTVQSHPREGTRVRVEMSL